MTLFIPVSWVYNPCNEIFEWLIASNNQEMWPTKSNNGRTGYLNCCNKKQDRIHGKTVADGWVGAVMQRPLENQKYL